MLSDKPSGIRVPERKEDRSYMTVGRERTRATQEALKQFQECLSSHPRTGVTFFVRSFMNPEFVPGIMMNNEDGDSIDYTDAGELFPELRDFLLPATSRFGMVPVSYVVDNGDDLAGALGRPVTIAWQMGPGDRTVPSEVREYVFPLAA